MTDLAIRCQNLGKDFKQTKKEPGVLGTMRSFFRPSYTTKSAVEAFDLEIPKGSFIGLLGPNGAGKTTIMKMLSGIIAPSHGVCEVVGHTPFQRSIAFRRNIALVMGQKGQLWWDIPAMDSFLLLQKYYEIPMKTFRRKLNHLLETLDVKDLVQVHIRKLSLGERMKMELIACLLHEPQVIFLDEPTIGLDVVAQTKIREFLAEYRRETGTTIILTSHYMADVDALCDRIVLIHGGRKKFDGSLSQFSSLLGQEKFVTVRFSTAIETTDEIWKPLDAKFLQENRSVELRIPDDDFRAVASAIFQKFPVVDFNSEKLPIERVMSTILTNPELLSQT
ncbi:MAG: ATP-binding cassette domain-containing protein [Pseudobacteriovorax sp.]|nr:ATP-binding cassette domain-containing protein [Pseudobacteriovorax sp.]